MELKGSKHLINVSIARILLKWIIKNTGWICVAQDRIPIKVLVNTAMTF